MRRLWHLHEFRTVHIERHDELVESGGVRATCGAYACYGMATQRCACGATRQRHLTIEETEEVR